MSLLFVARRPPFPLASGARIRTHRLLTGLAETFETTLITVEENVRGSEGSMARSELERLGAGRVELCPNGADPVDRLPPPTRRADEPLRMLFVGSVDWQPNSRGLLWFLEKVWPLVREVVASVFDIVESRRRPLPAIEGVAYHGRVPSVVPFYEQAHVAIVPVLYGSGTRLKVLEAMALGRPVVSTTLGAEGLPVAGGDHYLAADDETSFARELVDLASAYTGAGASIETMLERARSAVAPLFWPRIVERLADTYRAEVEKVRGRPTARERSRPIAWCRSASGRSRLKVRPPRRSDSSVPGKELTRGESPRWPRRRG